MFEKVGAIIYALGAMMGENESLAPAVITMLIGAVIFVLGVRRSSNERR